MASPIISIVMPVRNGADLLGRALDSVRAQTFTDWELLVVDDASEDDTPRILREAVAADSRIHVFRHTERRGVSAARNTALSHARGDLIAYLDHDDEFAPRHLARCR